MHLWMSKFKDIQKHEKNVKTAIVAANNHYAGFGPMSAKLFAEMMNFENKIRPFPIVDYEVPFKEIRRTEEEKNKQNFKIYKQLRYKTRQTDISEFFK